MVPTSKNVAFKACFLFSSAIVLLLSLRLDLNSRTILYVQGAKEKKPYKETVPIPYALSPQIIPLVKFLTGKLWPATVKLECSMDFMKTKRPFVYKYFDAYRAGRKFKDNEVIDMYPSSQIIGKATNSQSDHLFPDDVFLGGDVRASVEYAGILQKPDPDASKTTLREFCKYTRKAAFGLLEGFDDTAEDLIDFEDREEVKGHEFWFAPKILRPSELEQRWKDSRELLFESPQCIINSVAVCLAAKRLILVRIDFSIDSTILEPVFLNIILK